MTASLGLEVERRELPNGVVLLLHPEPRAPLVALRGSLPAGSSRETPETAGAAAMTSRLLRRGSRRSSGPEISARAEDLGAAFGVSSGVETAGFWARCLAPDTETILQVLREVLEEPAFPEDQVERTRREILTQIHEREDSTRYLADAGLFESLYPATHPYCRPLLGTAASISALTTASLREFHERWYGPRGIRHLSRT